MTEILIGVVLGICFSYAVWLAWGQGEVEPLPEPLPEPKRGDENLFTGPSPEVELQGMPDDFGSGPPPMSDIVTFEDYDDITSVGQEHAAGLKMVVRDMSNTFLTGRTKPGRGILR